MVQITKEMVLAMHEDLIRTGGQIHGILYEGTIDYIVGEINFVPGVYAKAAWALLCQGIILFLMVIKERLSCWLPRSLK